MRYVRQSKDLWNKAQRDAIMRRDGRVCTYCGKPGNTIDHIIPISYGGLTTLSNGVCACRKCNNNKRDNMSDIWMLKAFVRQWIMNGDDISWMFEIYHMDNVMEVVRLIKLKYPE